jgi:predicted DsbA family dithiol-disulfide isomerase
MADIPQVVGRLKKTADSLGLPFASRNMTYNSRRAQELGKWADAEGRGERFHQLAFDAYFAHGKNIARMAVLKALASTAGLDGDAAERVLAEGRYKADVDRDWQRAYEVGITAVPTFQMNDTFLVGAQPYEAIRDLVEKSCASKRIS